MKNHFKKFNLIALSLLGTFLMVCIINVTSGQTWIPTATPGDTEHRIRLHSLFLWNNPGGDTLSMKINTGENFLSIQGGLAIGSGNRVEANTDSSVIGGGHSNKLLGGTKNSGIAGGENNQIINSKNSLIGGGKGNIISSDSAIIGGGNENQIENNAENSAILGGKDNLIENGENSIILGGEQNYIEGKNSLVFGVCTKGHTGSFVFGIGNTRNRSCQTYIISKENSARIDAKSGVLIGTLNPINNVKLVISGAVKLNNSQRDGQVGGEIRVEHGCIYAYDGNNWQVMGKSSRESCNGPVQTCQFGETLLYQGDQVDAYTNFWSEEVGCHTEKVHITCSGGNLINSNTHATGTYYPYCYKIGNKKPEKCDINEDGVIDRNDQQIISNRVANGEGICTIEKCDLNGDNSISISDVLYQGCSW